MGVHYAFVLYSNKKLNPNIPIAFTVYSPSMLDIFIYMSIGKIIDIYAMLFQYYENGI